MEDELLVTGSLLADDGGESGIDDGDTAGGSSNVTPVVLLSAFVGVNGSFAYGFASGYSSAAKNGLINDLGLSTAAYSVFGASMTIGGIVGAIMSGRIADLIGRRLTMWMSGIIMLIGWLAIIFPEGAWWIDVGRILTGLGIGIHCYVVPAYIGEISPKATRGAFSTANMLMLTCGMSVVYFIGNYFSWRTLAIIGTIPNVIEIIGLFFIPESPRWLAKKGKEKEFEASLRRLRGQNADITLEAAQIREYVEILQQLPKERFKDLFKRKYAHSLTIGVGLVVLAVFGGTVAISYYATSIFETAGCSVSVATTTMAIIQIPFSALGVYLMDRAGRRPLWMIGAVGTCLGNFLAGLGFLLQDVHQSRELTSISVFSGIMDVHQTRELTSILVFSGIMVYVCSFSAGMSGTPWIIMSEILPLDIKGSAGSFITFINWASACIAAYSFNFILDWSPAVTFFVFSGICGATLVFVAKMVPETKGRSLEEIQASFTLFKE